MKALRRLLILFRLINYSQRILFLISRPKTRNSTLARRNLVRARAPNPGVVVSVGMLFKRIAAAAAIERIPFATRCRGEDGAESDIRHVKTPFSQRRDNARMVGLMPRYVVTHMPVGVEIAALGINNSPQRQCASAGADFHEQRARDGNRRACRKWQAPPPRTVR